jgi:hypothetical protein
LSAQPAVLQVVILRDGLLVGTEVFVPGSYTLGSAEGSDVRLDDPSIGAQHATLYFQNGRAAIQDGGTPLGVYVNGHRVKACEVRSQDEVTCGPFVMKIRVVSKAPAEKPAPPPEVAALLKGTPPSAKAPPPQRAGGRHTPSPGPTVAARQSPVELAATVPGPSANTPARDGPGTVYSARKRAEIGNAVPPPPAVPPINGHGRKGRPIDDPPTEAVMIPEGLDLDDVIPTGRGARGDPATSRVQLEDDDPFDFGQSRSAPPPPAPREKARSRQPQTDEEPSLELAIPAKAKKEKKAAKPRAAKAPKFKVGKGTPKLYFELWWGDARQNARSFKPDPKHPVIAEADELADLPLYGFPIPEDGFLLAEARPAGFRVFVPPGAQVETKKGESFFPTNHKDLESHGAQRYLSLNNGDAVRFSAGEMSLVAYVAPPPERVFVSPLFGLNWLAMITLLMCLGAFGTFLYYAPRPQEMADFTARNLPPVAVRLIAPEPKKKEEAKKALEKIKEASKKEEHKKEAPKVAKAEKPQPKPQPVAQVEKVTKLLSKLTSAGPGSKDILSAMDKLGNGPGSKLSKNTDYKLSGLIGKAPFANAGLGTFGLGGGGRGGFATQGAELLHGRGAGGIGALGVGGVGRGAVGGIVTRASARNVAVQGSIDREAVAKVVNSHLQEVRACYERALLKDPSLSGKVVLEWSISTAGRVVSAKTKNSTLRNGEVEGCILNNLKTWQFPLAHGGVVIISYPFLFNSVGY